MKQSLYFCLFLFHVCVLPCSEYIEPLIVFRYTLSFDYGHNFTLLGRVNGIPENAKWSEKLEPLLSSASKGSDPWIHTEGEPKKVCCQEKPPFAAILFIQTKLQLFPPIMCIKYVMQKSEVFFVSRSNSAQPCSYMEKKTDKRGSICTLVFHKTFSLQLAEAFWGRPGRKNKSI